MAKRNISFQYRIKIKKKRPGVHSKNRNTKHKHGKYYSGTAYRGQGR